MLMLLILSGCMVGEVTDCTGPEDFANATPLQVFGTETGPVEAVMSRISLNMRDTSQSIYDGIIDSGFARVVTALMLLYVTLYGVMIAMGVEKVRLGDAAIRIAKLGFLAAMLSPGGFDFFFNIAGRFFIDGTDQVLSNILVHIRLFSQSMNFTNPTAVQNYFSSGSAEVTGDPYDMAAHADAFQVLDLILLQLFSPAAVHFYLACLVAFPFGWIFLFMLALGILYYLPAVASAIWVYLISSMAKTLLIGLAPLFVSFMLFRVTRNYFEAWLKQLISFTLQPILVFSFLAIYSLMLDVAFNQAIGAGQQIQTCLIPMNLLGFQFNVWGFTQGNEPLMTTLTGTGPYGLPGVDWVFPLAIEEVIVFCAIAWIAWKIQPMVEDIAQELSTVYVKASKFRAHNPTMDLPGIASNTAGSFARTMGRGASRTLRGKPSLLPKVNKRK